MIRRLSLTLALLLILFIAAEYAEACTNILVSRGATKDGSVMISYSADGAFMPKLLYMPPREFKEGELMDVRAWEDDVIVGRIRAARKTYAVVGLVNEYQVAIAETTTGGREELHNPQGMLDYDGLMMLALQHSKTAREAIANVARFAQEYGYQSEGESLSIADKNEVWLMEIIGRGPGVKGILWVAARVPDGCITAHANMSRITTFPLNDPDNWLHAPDVVDFAVGKGYYDPKSGAPFSWRDSYFPDLSVGSRRACAGRVWSIYRRAAPSANFSDAWFRGLPGTEDYPLFIKPDEKLSTRDVMSLMRDHYEGTPYDMTQGIDAGPFHSPYRFRNLGFKVDDVSYMWERPISSQQAGFVMVAQLRNWLPDAVGGVYWYTPDDAYTSVFTPLYCGINRLPRFYDRGDHNRFSWDSAWWICNLVSNMAYDRWNRIYPEIAVKQKEHEDLFFQLQPAVEEYATELHEKGDALARKFLTDYSCGTAEQLSGDWKEFATWLITRHNDGYLNEFDGQEPKGIGYAEDWLRRVIGEKGKQLRVSAAH